MINNAIISIQFHLKIYCSPFTLALCDCQDWTAKRDRPQFTWIFRVVEGELVEVFELGAVANIFL